MDFSEDLRHIRQRDLVEFGIVLLRLLYNLILLVKGSKRGVFLDKVPQLAGVDKVQIASHVRSRTLEVKAFHKDMLGIFISLKSRRDFRGVFGNTLNQ